MSITSFELSLRKGYSFLDLILDNLINVNYSRGMDTQKEITRKQFDEIEARYKEALLKRRNTIIRQTSSMTLTEIAKYWGKDLSRITRILKPQKTGEN